MSDSNNEISPTTVKEYNVESKAAIVSGIVSKWRQFSKLERQALTAIACGSENRGCTTHQVIAAIIDETNINRIQLFIATVENFVERHDHSRMLQSIRMRAKNDHRPSSCSAMVCALSVGFIATILIYWFIVYNNSYHFAFMRRDYTSLPEQEVFKLEATFSRPNEEEEMRLALLSRISRRWSDFSLSERQVLNTIICGKENKECDLGFLTDKISKTNADTLKRAAALIYENDTATWISALFPIFFLSATCLTVWYII